MEKCVGGAGGGGRVVWGEGVVLKGEEVRGKKIELEIICGKRQNHLSLKSMAVLYYLAVLDLLVKDTLSEDDESLDS